MKNKIIAIIFFEEGVHVMKEVKLKIIGRRLMILRGERTQKEVALAVGVSDSAIRQYERGRRMPRYDIMGLIARYFKISIQALFFQFDEQEVESILKNRSNEVIERNLMTNLMCWRGIHGPEFC
jgi:transcriptional regulator with XRE-family HTH domain